MAFSETPASLERVFNHLVLPPQLPSKQDDSIEKIGYSIMRRIRRACEALTLITTDQFVDGCAAIDAGLSSMSQNDGTYRTISSLLDSFQLLRDEDRVVPFYIAEQNAGLLMYSRTKYVYQRKPFFFYL